MTGTKPVIHDRPEEIYRFGHLIRRFESLLLKQFGEGLLSGTTHTCIGQELCQMSVVRALNHPDDAVLSNHRNHGHFLTYSGDFLGLMSEIMGREAGVCGGIGGSQHLAYRHFHSNGVQAGMTGIGVGLAMARKVRGGDAIVAAIVGDGTSGEGMLYESMNLASIWGLRMLFVVEHNGIAQTTPTAGTIGGGDIRARGAAFGLRTWTLDDASPTFIADVEAIVAEMRDERSPGLLVIHTQRLGPHSKGDDLRSADEMDAIRRRDPLDQLGRQLGPMRAEIEAANDEFLESVRVAAERSPPASRLIADRHVFHAGEGRGAHRAANGAPPSAGNVRTHLNAALGRLLDEHPDVVVLGEDLHDPYGGAFKVTAGLQSRHPDRVVSTPISEAGVIGTGIGLAMAGFRPIVEIMFADFLTLGMDQIYNHAVKFGGMFPDTRVPLVIRTPSGGRRGYGPTHSQSLESLMVAVPGLTVVFPSHRHDAGALLEDAVLAWPNPTVFFEHKLLYGEAASAGGYEVVPSRSLGTDIFPTLRRGSSDPDVTLVAYGGMLPIVEAAASELAEEEIEVEVIVPSLLAPLPEEELLALLRDRPRVAVVEEGYVNAGFGQALGSCLAEAGYSGRFGRVGTPPVPIPAARSLESRVMPDRAAVLRLVVSLLSE